jgi:pyruvate/2-oxoglutarate dehydrogenase complex dihydrolipoamide acyltransferase (E2) component
MKKSRVNANVDTAWRRTTIAIYRPPVDGKIFGTFEVDVSHLLEFLEGYKKKGYRLTLTQVIAAALGRSLSVDLPEINAYVKRGRIIPRDSVDIFVSVYIKETGDMTGFVIRNIDEKSLTEIAEEMDKKVEKYRAAKEQGAVKNKNMLAAIPWPFRIWVFRLIRFITVGLGWKLRFLKVDSNSFGSAMLTNIGTHGLQFGFPALFPAANIPMVLVMGKVDKKPVVRNNKVVIRDILPMAGTFDHRIFDGSQGGKLAKAMERYLTEPELLETTPVVDDY